MSSLKEESIDSNKLWKTAGKPHYGPLFDSNLDLDRYRKRVKEGKKLNILSYTHDLLDTPIHKKERS